MSELGRYQHDVALEDDDLREQGGHGGEIHLLPRRRSDYERLVKPTLAAGS